MEIVAVDKIEKFVRKHANARASLSSWLLIAEGAEWTCPQDVKNCFSSADILSGNRIVFNIGGNNYRLVVLARYRNGILLIQKVGTHAEYDRWKLD
ncbi:MAG: type II toxin-antitoxin system HigB family toxin [Luteolibacter sp.]